MRLDHSRQNEIDVFLWLSGFLLQSQRGYGLFDAIT